MLQNKLTNPVLAAVLLTATAGLLLQKPNLGLKVTLQPQLAAIVIDYPSSTELLERELKTSPEEPQIAEANPEPDVNEVKTEQRVASAQDHNEVFIDTINRALPPQVEKSEDNVDIVGLINKYAAQYGAEADMMIAIARCESGFNENAISPSGAYKGMFQFVTSTWQSNRRAMGEDESPALMFDAEEAIKTAAFKMGRDGYNAWPVCSQKALAALSVN